MIRWNGSLLWGARQRHGRNSYQATLIPTLMGTRELWAQQRLDRATLVHGAVSLRHLVQGKCQVEDLARFDLPVPNLLDQVGQIPPHRSRAAVQANVGEKQLRAIKADAMRNADIAHRTARTNW